ncbi:hypothetical protein JXR93_02540, partial [bacterium]|nr:hypothetical protein [bacterium]
MIEKFKTFSNSLKIGTKFIIGIVFLFLITLFTTLTLKNEISNMGNINIEMYSMYQVTQSMISIKKNGENLKGKLKDILFTLKGNGDIKGYFTEGNSFLNEMEKSVQFLKNTIKDKKGLKINENGEKLFSLFKLNFSKINTLPKDEISDFIEEELDGILDNFISYISYYNDYIDENFNSFYKKSEILKTGSFKKANFYTIFLAIVILIFSITIILALKFNISKIVKDVEFLNSEIQKGNLDIRGDVYKIGVDFRKIIIANNELIETFVKPINFTSKHIQDISEGRDIQEITDIFYGDFNIIKNNLNRLIDANKKIAEIAQKISNGDFNIDIKERSD